MSTTQVFFFLLNGLVISVFAMER